MKKLLVMGMIFASVIAPMLLARDPKAARGYKKLRWMMVVITMLWGLLLKYFYFKMT